MTYVPAEHKTDGQRQTNLTPISFILNEVKDFQNIHIIILNQYTEYVWLMSFYEPHTLLKLKAIINSVTLKWANVCLIFQTVNM